VSQHKKVLGKRLATVRRAPPFVTTIVTTREPALYLHAPAAIRTRDLRLRRRRRPARISAVRCFFKQARTSCVEPAPASNGRVVTTIATTVLPESERWLERERARRRDAAASTRTLVERAEAAGQLAAAIDLGRRSTRLAALDEAVVQRLIASLDGVGDRAVGARTFEEFASRLAQELEVEASPETRRS